MQELEVTGSYFDIGYQIGVFGKKQIQHVLEMRGAQLKKTLAKVAKLRATVKAIKEATPYLLEELEGIATGAEVSFDELLAKHCPEVINAYGCTTVAVKNKKGFIVAHNEDDDSWLRPESYALVTYRPINGLKFTAFVTLGDLPGSTFTWNAAGLFFAVDAMVQQGFSQLTGLPRYFQNAALIEQTSLVAAIKFLRKTKAASSDHYLIGDTRAHKAVSLEKSKETVSVKRINGLYIHTNHFIHPKFHSGYQGTEKFGTSKERLVIAEKIFSPNDNAQAMVRKLTTKLKRPLHKNDQNKTWATVLCDLNTGLVSVVS